MLSKIGGLPKIKEHFYGFSQLNDIELELPIYLKGTRTFDISISNEKWCVDGDRNILIYVKEQIGFFTGCYHILREFDANLLEQMDGETLQFLSAHDSLDITLLPKEMR